MSALSLCKEIFFFLFYFFLLPFEGRYQSSYLYILAEHIENESIKLFCSGEIWTILCRKVNYTSSYFDPCSSYCSFILTHWCRVANSTTKRSYKFSFFLKLFLNSDSCRVKKAEISICHLKWTVESGAG